MTERNGALVTRLGPEITEIPLERLEAEICELAGHLFGRLVPAPRPGDRAFARRDPSPVVGVRAGPLLS